MNQQPRRRPPLKGKYGIRIVTTGIAVVLLFGLLSLFIQARHTTNTQAARRTPVASATNAMTRTPVPTATPTISPVQLIPVQVRAYTIEGKMADGKMTHAGACAVSLNQFPLGSILALYNKDDHTLNRQCTAEDSGGDIQDGQIDLAMPGDSDGAQRGGVRDMLVHVVRRGWNG